VAPQGTFSVKGKRRRQKAHGFEIEIEKGSQGESQIGEVLGDNVGVRLSFGRSGG